MYLVSRTETFAKLFFIISFTGLFMYLTLAFYSFHTAFSNVFSISKYHEHSGIQQIASYSHMKYILVWMVNNSTSVEEGQEPFLKRDCTHTNCYWTTNKSLLNEDYTNFDVVLFNISTFRSWRKPLLPKRRSLHQKYVFYGMELANERPICNVVLDNYFNWTWSYKFNSDIYNPFIEVKDVLGNVIAPKKDASWEYLPKNDDLMKHNKTKALVMVMEDCDQKIKTGFSIKKLTKALRHHSLVFDIYGCGNNSWKCPRSGCEGLIRKNYYFYLVSENNGAEDVVTAEVLKAYDNDAVPVIVGGVDLSKFLPEGSYIDYSHYTAQSFAALLEYTIKNPVVYNNYFAWKKRYTIQKVDKERGLCDLCTMLNDRAKFEMYSNYESFREWWNLGQLRDRCFPKGAETLQEVLAYENETGRF